MASKYCASCGTQVMATMRVCPQCGSQGFSLTQLPSNATTQTNPLNKPQTSNLRNQAPVNIKPAGHFKRSVAYLIDMLVTGVMGIIIITILIALGVLDSESRLALNGYYGLRIVVGILVSISYFTLMLITYKRATVGQLLCDLKVVTTNNQRLSFGTSFFRIFLNVIIGLCLLALPIFYNIYTHTDLNVLFWILLPFIPFLTVFFNKNHQTLYDMICNTRVIAI